MKDFIPERIYLHKGSKQIFGEAEIDGKIQIVFEPIERNLDNYKKTGENNAFVIYDRKKYAK